MEEHQTPKGEAEELKKQGNELFALKKYEEAIDIYNKALELDKTNAVLWSNRSACYASLKQWQKSLEDAATAISVDPAFIKAYYRLATAQTELSAYDDAVITLKAALSREPNNDQIARQLKIVQQKKFSIANAVNQGKPKKQMTEAQRKEAIELQEQTNNLIRELKSVQSRISATERESRTNQVTMTHMASLDAAIPMYRAVGKAFFLSNKSDIESRLGRDHDSLVRSQRELIDKQEYLERRINSSTTHLKDLMNEYAM